MMFRAKPAAKNTIVDTQQKIILRDGSEVTQEVYSRTCNLMIALYTHCQDPYSVISLVNYCQKPETNLLPFTKQQLTAYGFLVNNEVPLDVKNVVLNSVTKDKDGMLKLIDPKKQEEPAPTAPRP